MLIKRSEQTQFFDNCSQIAVDYKILKKKVNF